MKTKILAWILVFQSFVGMIVLFALLLYGATTAYLFVRKALNSQNFEHLISAELERDLKTCSVYEPRPYYYWKKKPCSTPLVNIGEDQARKTVKNPQPNAKKVFCFGGSSLWGADVADQDTLPSKLQARLGPGFDVYNFGEDAFNSVQELNLLLEKLSANQVPDYVIFYDGGMDALNGVYSPAIPRGPQVNYFEWSPDSMKRQLQHLLQQTSLSVFFDYLNQREAEQWLNDTREKIPENSAATVDDYIAFARQVAAIGREYRFTPFFFWQPDLLSGTKRVLAPHEKLFLAGKTKERVNSVEIEAVSTVYRLAEIRFAELSKTPSSTNPPIYFEGHLFDDITELVYHDDAHIEAAAGDRVVNAILLRIGDQMK